MIPRISFALSLLLHLSSAFLLPRTSRSPLFYSTRDDCIELAKDTLQPFFNFPLDDWQLQAGGAIKKGWNVIVCAPTGAGKTVVGEMALYHAHSLNRKAAYTTPLKALSNQVYTKLNRMFDDVGLSTGDISVNKGAQITVMTTEVYRNIAWRSSSGTSELEETAVCVLDELHYMGLPGRGSVWEESIITTPSSTQIVGLSATLSNALDLAAWMEHVTERKTILIDVPAEFRPVPLRYLFAVKEGLYPLFRDPDAGPGAPKGMLGYLGEGLSSDQVPKKKGFSETKTKEQLPRGLQVNPALVAAGQKRIQKVTRSLERQKVRRDLKSRSDGDDYDYEGRGRGRKFQAPRKMSPREEQKEKERLLRNEMRRSVPTLSGLLKRLQHKNQLPAIFFIFSRAGCDQAAQGIVDQFRGPRDPNRLVEGDLGFEKSFDDRPRASRKGKKRKDILETIDGRSFRSSNNYIDEEMFTALLEEDSSDDGLFDPSSPLSNKNWRFYAAAGLLEYEQVRDVASRITTFNEQNPEIAFDDEVAEQLLFGVGAHHAGMLPAHKSFVEILFRNQLMKVVFATETLAAGINMPARTTVICSMAKRGDGSSMNLLETSNLLQMAGRAGRRGMDTDGTCVIVATPFESHDEAAKILTDPIKPIRSQFTPSYSLAVNLIARGLGKLDVAQELVSKSFAMWEKQRLEASIAKILDENEGADEVLEASAQERFMNMVVDCLENQIQKRSAQFNNARLEEFLALILDREALKKTSKSYLASARTFELEDATLGYLKTERKDLKADLEELYGGNDIPNDDDDENEVIRQIEDQERRVEKAAKDLRKHQFTSLASFLNILMSEDSKEGIALSDALQSARISKSSDAPLSAEELCLFSKSAVVVRRKARKLANQNGELDADEFLNTADQAVSMPDASWDDMLAITRTLVTYGCLTVDGTIEETTDLSTKSFQLTQAGTNIAMLGFENALWTVVAVGGAWDVMGMSSRSRRLQAFESVQEGSDIPPAQREAMELRNNIQDMDVAEFAGYISCIVGEGARSGGPSVIELFHQLSSSQQRVIQTCIQSMDRLMEVQREFSVDERSRVCNLDISSCEVVTAWAGGCSWNEALEISGSSPGDLARILSRVLDAVRQLGNLPFRPIRKDDFEDSILVESPGIHPEIRRLCRETAKAINRYPVKDPLAFETDEEVEDELFDDSEDTDSDVDYEDSDEDSS